MNRKLRTAAAKGSPAVEKNQPILLRLPDELFDFVVERKRAGENKQDVIKELIRREAEKAAQQPTTQ